MAFLQEQTQVSQRQIFQMYLGTSRCRQAPGRIYNCIYAG